MMSSQPGMAVEDAEDRRFMAAAIRFSRKHQGLTSTNPSVGTLIVRNDGAGPVIVGRGVTEIGGRPHAEAAALAEAGDRARGATAYVTLEPCAHHGRTPPCATALVSAGVSRVVGAASDPDPRVSGQGYRILRNAGIEVCEGVLADQAADQLRGYLIRSLKKRPEVTLKLAVSRDGMIGRLGEGQVPISGVVSRRQVHLMRAEADTILVGVKTAIIDDPELTVRLPGLENRSPARIVLDRHGRLPLTGKMVAEANTVPVFDAISANVSVESRRRLEAAGVKLLATEQFEDRIALPELLEDLAAQGVSTLFVEGGAQTADLFMADGLVDRIVLLAGDVEIGEGGIASPVSMDRIPAGFRKIRDAVFGADRYAEYVRED